MPVYAPFQVLAPVLEIAKQPKTSVSSKQFHTSLWQQYGQFAEVKMSIFEMGLQHCPVGIYDQRSYSVMCFPSFTNYRLGLFACLGSSLQWWIHAEGFPRFPSKTPFQRTFYS
jgi:hypothetical protein